jgi:hypothetical protein
MACSFEWVQHFSSVAGVIPGNGWRQDVPMDLGSLYVRAHTPAQEKCGTRGGAIRHAITPIASHFCCASRTSDLKQAIGTGRAYDSHPMGAASCAAT